jgi:hypothetical protein
MEVKINAGQAELEERMTVKLEQQTRNLREDLCRNIEATRQDVEATRRDLESRDTTSKPHGETLKHSWRPWMLQRGARVVPKWGPTQTR